MRYIDISHLAIPSNWTIKARKEKYSPLWSALKPELETLVGKKCWYNESINDGTSNPVDHFRPKSARIQKFTAKYAKLETVVWNQLLTGLQSGYPFLELEHSNYRYACGFANSTHHRESIDGITRGKSNFFPLRSGSASATTIAGIASEEVALLDPCKSGDAELLSFNEFGGIDPSEAVLTGSWNYCRVKVSIEVYNLVYIIISTKRQELWTSTMREIEMMTVLYNKPNKTVEEQMSFDHLFINLIKSLQKKAEYSAVVIDCIKQYRKRKDRIIYKWIHNEIPNHLLIK